MKKYFINFVLICSCLFPISNVNAGVWDLWAEEDEEANMSVGSVKKTTTTTTTRNFSSQPSTLQTSLRQTTQPKNVVIQQPRYDNTTNVATYSNPMQGNNIVMRNSLTSNNNDNYNIIDYDTIQAERDIKDAEVLNSIDKWQLGSKSVYWENYRGNNIRIEVLRNNRDLKEMRLKFVQSQDIISDPDGSISDMLNKVAEQVMKRTCGKKAKQSIILYERPSIELLKETSYDNYKIVARGTSLKEYGFRCIY
ncbi:MAG: hypothetical protein ACI4N3_00035 [Alphaproteobacteria bacterium]